MAEPVLRGNVVAACEVVADPEDEEAGPAVPRPTTPSPLVPRLAVPRLDASGAKTVAIAAVVAGEPVVVLHGAKVPPCVPIEPAVLLWAPIELAVLPWASIGLAAAMAPRLNPPPSNVGSAAVLGLAPGHAVEFTNPKTLLAFCDRPAPLSLGCNGEVACRAGIGGMLVCATLTPMPGPASAMARARKPLIRVLAPKRI